MYFGISIIIAEKDNARHVFAILLPITFPKTITPRFLLAAEIEVASSGREFPNATMENPIILSETLKYCAIAFAPFISKSLSYNFV